MVNHKRCHFQGSCCELSKGRNSCVLKIEVFHHTLLVNPRHSLNYKGLFKGDQILACQALHWELCFQNFAKESQKYFSSFKIFNLRFLLENLFTEKVNQLGPTILGVFVCFKLVNNLSFHFLVARVIDNCDCPKQGGHWLHAVFIRDLHKVVNGSD